MAAAIRLVADVGASNARFALSARSGELSATRVLACRNFPSITDAIAAYLAGAGNPPVRDAILAVATPVLGDEIHMTNHSWSFSIEASRRALGLRTLLVVNDFVALALALPFLAPADLQGLDARAAPRPGVKAVIGPGTGLGVAGLVPTDAGWEALATEGGHASLAATSAQETAILQVLWQTYGHVSNERLISGTGIPLLYASLCTVGGWAPAPEAVDAAAVVRLARSGACPAAVQTCRVFSALLGSFAGNVALTLGSTGGLYLGGGVLAHMGALFDVSSFRARFLAKGRFANYLEAIPTYLIRAEYPALTGALHRLERHLASAV